MSSLVPTELVHPLVVELILKEHPDWPPHGFICLHDLNRFRGEYFEDLLSLDKGELSALEAQVIASLKAEEDLISQNLNIDFERRLAVAQHADLIVISTYGRTGPQRLIIGSVTEKIGCGALLGQKYAFSTYCCIMR